MVERELRRIVLLESRGIAHFSTTKSTGDLLLERFLFTEFVEQGLVEEILDVPRVVEGRAGGRGLGGFLLVARLTGIDS